MPEMFTITTFLSHNAFFNKEDIKVFAVSFLMAKKEIHKENIAITT